jgi:hypothetical protein
VTSQGSAENPGYAVVRAAVLREDGLGRGDVAENDMKTIAKWAALTAVGMASITPVAAAPVCLNTFYIDSSRVVDPQTIIFRMKDGTQWRNTLRAPCIGLRFHGYTYNVKYTELCDYGQSIRVLESNEVCTLGSFTKIAPAHA